VILARLFPRGRELLSQGLTDGSRSSAEPESPNRTSGRAATTRRNYILGNKPHKIRFRDRAHPIRLLKAVPKATYDKIKDQIIAKQK
jgi:hypothetical protein